MQRLQNGLMSDPDAIVDGMIAKMPNAIVASYRRKFKIVEEAPLTVAMVRQHWTIERRGTRAILQSSRSNRAAIAEQAYTDLYRSCFWLNEQNRAPDRADVEFAALPGLLGPPCGSRPPRVYEIGSGKGELIRWLASLCYPCVGTEITAERGCRHVSENRFLTWHGTDGVNLTQFEALRSYDMVVSFQVLEHLHPDDIPLHLSGVADILEANGKYIFTTPHRFAGPKDLSEVFGLPYPVCHHLKEWTYHELVVLLQQAGFGSISNVYTPPLALRRISRVLNRSIESRRLLVFLIACERLLERLPSSLRLIGIKALRWSTVLRSDIYLSARKR